MADSTKTLVGASQKYTDLDGGTTYGAVVTGQINYVNVTAVCDTAAYGAGDLVFESVAIANAVRSGGSAILQSVAVIDRDDQDAGLSLYFWSADVDMGTVNSAVAVADDASLLKYLGHVDVTTDAWDDLGPGRVAIVKDINMVVHADAGTSIYMGATTGHTPTYTTDGLYFRFGFIQP